MNEVSHVTLAFTLLLVWDYVTRELCIHIHNKDVKMVACEQYFHSYFTDKIPTNGFTTIITWAAIGYLEILARERHLKTTT